MSFFLYQLLTLTNLSVLILTSTSILQTGKGNSVLTSPHPLTLTASLLSKHSPFVTTHSVYLGHACQIKGVPYFLPISYLFIFDERICYSGKSKLKLVGKEYPYIDSIISTIFVLGVFDLELPFSDSLGRKRNQGGTRRAVSVVVASVVDEVEHACTRTIDIAAASIEPSISEKREVRVIRVPSACTT